MRHNFDGSLGIFFPIYFHLDSDVARSADYIFRADKICNRKTAYTLDLLSHRRTHVQLAHQLSTLNRIIQQLSRKWFAFFRSSRRLTSIAPDRQRIAHCIYNFITDFFQTLTAENRKYKSRKKEMKHCTLRRQELSHLKNTAMSQLKISAFLLEMSPKASPIKRCGQIILFI